MRSALVSTCLWCLTVGVSATAQDLPATAAEALVGRLEALLEGGAAVPERLPEGVRFLVRFAADIDGLRVGAPVTVRGIRVGTVREVAVVIDTTAATIDVPIVIDVVPDLIDVDGRRPTDPAAVHALAERLVENGLRAALQSASPFGGPQHVALAFAPDAPSASLGQGGRYPEIPAAPSLAQELRSTLDGLLTRVAALPLETVVGEATATLVELRALVTAPEIRDGLDAIGAASAEIRALVAGPEMRAVLTTLVDAGRELQAVAAGLDTKLDPSIGALQRAAGSIEAAAAETTAAMSGLGRTVGPRSTIWEELMQTSRELSGTTRALRLLVEYLERHPDALLRGRPETRP